MLVLPESLHAHGHVSASTVLFAPGLRVWTVQSADMNSTPSSVCPSSLRTKGFQNGLRKYKHLRKNIHNPKLAYTHRDV